MRMGSASPGRGLPSFRSGGAAQSLQGLLLSDTGLPRKAHAAFLSTARWDLLVGFCAVVLAGDTLGLYAMGLIARRLHGERRQSSALKRGWSEKQTRRLGIGVSAALYALINAGLIAVFMTPHAPPHAAHDALSRAATLSPARHP